MYFKDCSTRKMILVAYVLILFAIEVISNQDIVGCGGFVQSTVPLNFERVEVKLYTKQGALKFKTECAPNNGYFLVAVYDKGEYTLKIDPPNGWSFSPTEISLNIDGKTDPCVNGKDINFKFTGFSVSGMVGSKGRPLGPSGVEVYLKGDGDDKRKNVTGDGGIYTFGNVMPGEYQITALHPVWTFQKNAASVVVKDDNMYSSNELVVSGYDVKGHVLSAGEPIQGVIFALFSDDVKPEDFTNCTEVSSDLMEKLSKRVNQPKVCSTISGKDGVFLFPSVPSGDYILVPYYSSQDIIFDVVPTKITFKVNYKSVVLKTPFQVHGFSVTGRVIDMEGKGLSGVMVKLGEETESVKTNAEGGFLLNNVTSGKYKIKASMENYFFDASDVHISPNSPVIPDIQVKRFSVCGTVNIQNTPPGISLKSQRKVMLLRNGSQNADMVTTSTDESGKFCFEVAPGVYRIEALISPSETKLGLLLTPAVVEATVHNNPILDIAFKQFLASVSGSLKCIGSCNDSKVVLTSIDKPNQEKVQGQIEVTKDGASFSFKNVLPGKYKLTPLREKWCWDPRSLEIDVINADLPQYQFNHVGFFLKCIISHNVTLNFSLEGSLEQVEPFSLKMGKNKFCLKSAGIYRLTPLSCYKFDQEHYIYDTSMPKELFLSAVGYQLLISVKSQKKLKDISLIVRSAKIKSEETLVPELVTSTNSEEISNNATKIKNKTEFYEYQTIYWARLNEEVKVTAKSSEVLFHPGTQTIKVEDKCPGGKLQFDGREGIFIKGTVSPKLKDVIVTIKTLATEKHKESKTIVVMTDENGSYSVGPMHNDIEYKVSAMKEGYVINDSPEKGSFIAMKLGQITVKVVDEDNQTMQGVLLSLSGGQYRSNNLTPESGTWTFSNLSPGQYFLRPMQKEYSFQPSSQMVDVKEGEEVQLLMQGKRVAFSFLGAVRTLAGDPETGISVEAVGMDACSEFQEDSITDKDGSYRLRGLQPNCVYNVQVKVGESNPDIERAGPTNRTIKVESADVSGVDFVVFYKPRTFELTATIDTEQEWLPNLKVLLYREDNFDSPLNVVIPGYAKFIHFPPLPLDNQFYVVRIESTLSKKLHVFDSTSASFTTRGSYKKHVELKFTVKEKKVEFEPTKSVITLPLAVALIVMAYNYTTILALFSWFNQRFRGQTRDHTDVVSDESSKAKKKRR